MGLKSFRKEEDTALFTLPNALTGIRAVGGVILGALLAWGRITPATALIAAAALAATDMEGGTISATRRWPRLQKAFRIIPSALGRIADPVADKIFAISIFLAGTLGGEIPIWQAVGILAAEAATSLATFYITAKGGKSETSKVGAWGMAARCGTIACDLGAAAIATGLLHGLLIAVGAAMATAAMLLGGLSCWKIYRTPTNAT
jgi:phosphatidylglycerophosphate synthase